MLKISILEAHGRQAVSAECSGQQLPSSTCLVPRKRRAEEMPPWNNRAILHCLFSFYLPVFSLSPSIASFLQKEEVGVSLVFICILLHSSVIVPICSQHVTDVLLSEPLIASLFLVFKLCPPNFNPLGARNEHHQQ